MRIHKNDTIYTVLTHVSRSGMMRHIECFVIRNNKPLNISHIVADTLKWPLAHDGVKVTGCGMDMGFHLVYTFAQALYKDGYLLKHQWLR